MFLEFCASKKEIHATEEQLCKGLTIPSAAL